MITQITNNLGLIESISSPVSCSFVRRNGSRTITGRCEPYYSNVRILGLNLDPQWRSVHIAAGDQFSGVREVSWGRRMNMPSDAPPVVRHINISDTWRLGN